MHGVFIYCNVSIFPRCVHSLTRNINVIHPGLRPIFALLSSAPFAWKLLLFALFSKYICNNNACKLFVIFFYSNFLMTVIHVRMESNRILKNGRLAQQAIMILCLCFQSSKLIKIGGCGGVVYTLDVFRHKPAKFGGIVAHLTSVDTSIFPDREKLRRISTLGL